MGCCFVFDWEGVVFDFWIMGKVFGGGIMLILVVVVDVEIFDLFEFGFYGFIFGGNLFVCVVVVVVL